MAYHHTPRPDVLGLGMVNHALEKSDLARNALRLFDGLAALPQTLRSWNTRRQTKTTLNKLSDRELADIGLNRGELGDLFK